MPEFDTVEIAADHGEDAASEDTADHGEDASGEDDEGEGHDISAEETVSRGGAEANPLEKDALYIHPSEHSTNVDDKGAESGSQLTFDKGGHDGSMATLVNELWKMVKRSNVPSDPITNFANFAQMEEDFADHGEDATGKDTTDHGEDATGEDTADHGEDATGEDDEGEGHDISGPVFDDVG
ncbi:hypothetical protein Salat_0477300 [Sesamum alatum]|uniref:Uncharacterized protein n=1 Tax=Sesamum alatum TaxID=300844 RepID=A0AAE2D147_9LAMI|nr:hypothetical protein Salat_0477300 [Sesamum alatum]